MRPDNPTFVQALVRLVPATAGNAPARPPRCYRPLIVGPAILHRPAAGLEPWTVDVSDDGRLMPLVPRSRLALQLEVDRLRNLGRHCRVATALICPADVPRADEAAAAAPMGKPGLRSEFYGWSIMVQPPGVHGRAFVDRDDANPDLPACFELPLELVDRIAYLESRGLRTRPIALITRPEDFEPVAGAWRNRFRPSAAFGKPCRIDRLL
jgi:hypothetical protein